MGGFAAAIVAALALGVLSTAYDFIWAMWIPRHRAIYGLIHGMTLLSAAGLALGWPVGRPLAGFVGGAAAGLLAAGCFYLLAPALGMTAMFPAWMVLWLLFAGLAAMVRSLPVLSADTLVRGVVAALASGAAFWLISGIWLEHGPGGPNYAWNFLCWTFAYFPGFAALSLGRERVPVVRRA